MAFLSLNDLGGYQCFDHDECSTLGTKLALQYAANEPFPHIVLDNFLDPELLRKVLDEFPDSSGHHYFDRDQERLKFQFRPDECTGAATRMLFAELSSRAFLTFLSGLTGIENLLADPYYAGAGLHETLKGGHLGIHADFPKHDMLGVQRRLNLLIYLNDDWRPEYGGALELWDRKMRKARHAILPEFGRAVIFSTDRHTYHGHPDPLACPDGRSRRSIATYYYTAESASAPLERATDFRRRPGTGDRTDWSMWFHNLKADWLPQALQRQRIRQRLRRQGAATIDHVP